MQLHWNVSQVFRIPFFKHDSELGSTIKEGCTRTSIHFHAEPTSPLTKELLQMTEPCLKEQLRLLSEALSPVALLLSDLA